MMRPLLPVPGVAVGHWTDEQARTGCSVLLFDRPFLAAAEVRGGAPGTRELESLGGGRIGRRADAILVTGGSAFGLAAADGVMSHLREHQRGFVTSAGPVPIVPAAVIYDLANGAPVAPDADAGYAACRSAKPLADASFGRVGAGTGARFGAIGGPGSILNGGIGIGQHALDTAIVTAIVVLNAFGVVRNDSFAVGEDPRETFVSGDERRDSSLTADQDNSTLVAVIVDDACDHQTLQNLCVAAHDGLARRVVPSHTEVDGDVAFAVAIHEAPEERIALHRRLRLTMAVELAVERAVLDAARSDASNVTS